MGMSEELERLHALHRSGGLSDEEYARAKDRLLTADGQPPRPLTEAHPVDVERKTREWSQWIHFSMLAGLLVPGAGLIAPIVLWQIKKEELPGVDVHGRIAVNWILSVLIYGVASAILILVLIGIPLLIALAVLSIVFPILGGIKAGKGEVWPYPLSIRFLGPPTR
jgi:uncharacterized Tic20 family protein